MSRTRRVSWLSSHHVQNGCSNFCLTSHLQSPGWPFPIRDLWPHIWGWREALSRWFSSLFADVGEQDPCWSGVVIHVAVACWKLLKATAPKAFCTVGEWKKTKEMSYDFNGCFFPSGLFEYRQFHVHMLYYLSLTANNNGQSTSIDSTLWSPDITSFLGRWMANEAPLWRHPPCSLRAR